MVVEQLRDRFAVTNGREVGLVSGAHAVNELFSLALPPILPLLIAGFGVDYARAGLLVAAYFGMYAVFQLPAGSVADRVGPGRLIWVGTAVMGAGMALASAAPSYPALIGAVAIAGVGGSTYHPAGMSLISDVEADETAGKAMGVHELAGILGNMAAPVLIGGLAVLTDWRLALGATGAVGLGYAAVFALSWDHQPAPKPATESAGDGGVDEAPSPAAGVVTRLRHGVADLVRVPLAWWVLGLFLTKLLFTIQTYGVRTYLTAFVAARSGLAAGGANGIFFLFLAGSAVATVWFGALADRFSRLHLLAATFLAAAAAIAATAVVPASLAVFAVWFFVLGIAAYAALPVVNTLVSEYAEAEFSGSLFGIVQTASALGGTVSPVLFGEVASRFGIRTAFPAIAVVCLVAGVGFVVAAGRDG